MWGCLSYYKNTNPNRTKLGPIDIKCVFVGYDSNNKSYILLILKTNVIIELVTYSSLRIQYLWIMEIHKEIPSSNGTQDETSSKDVNESSEPQRSKITRIEKFLGSDEIDTQLISFYLVEETDHKTYREVMASRDSVFWKYAIKDEIDSIMSNNKWILVDLLPGSKHIGCKWVFRKSIMLMVLLIPLKVDW